MVGGVDRRRHRGCLADDGVFRDESEHAGVAALVTVVAHDEVLPIRDRYRAEEPHCGELGRDHDRVVSIAELLCREQPGWPVAVLEVADLDPRQRAVSDRLLVDEEAVVAERQTVARESDDPLDQPLAVGRGEQHHDVTALRARPARETPPRERHLEVVRQLVDDDAVPFEDGRLHRARRHVVPVGDGGAEPAHRHQDDEQGLDPLVPEPDQLLLPDLVHECLDRPPMGHPTPTGTQEGSFCYPAVRADPERAAARAENSVARLLSLSRGRT